MLASLLIAQPVQASSPIDFETQEYRNSTGLWVINAAQAYAKGYTGKGITLGVLDTGVNSGHFEFQGKDIVWVPCKGYIYDWVTNDHGSHVAGIMAANRDGADISGNMHGVAFDANLLAMGTFLDGEHESPMGELIKAVLSRPDVKIVNNSWGDSLFFLDALFKAKTDEEKTKVLTGLRDVISGYRADSFLENLAQQDKLMVFAAGNAGHRGPSAPASFRSFLPDLDNWISVVALDSTDGRITMASDGKTKVLTDSAIPTYSELAMGAEEYTLAAPGTWINSVEATGGYVELIGTSMAAPYVSGTLGLVQQAFPWMSARQMADTVLSTADRSFNAPQSIISVGEDRVTDSGTGKPVTKMEIRLQLVDKGADYQDRNQTSVAIPSAGTPERTRLENYLRQYYQENETLVHGYYGIKTPDEFIAAFFATEENPYEITLSDGTLYGTIYGSIQNVPFDQIFGQGIVDAGKAVDGPSQLNANRMSPADLSSQKIRGYTGKTELLYGVDTKGYVSAWNNDISQELWHENRHDFILPEFLGKYPDYVDTMKNQTSVGLLKNGEGTLYLTGTNSYTGSTVIKGGTLSISRRPDHSGGELTASDVHVLPEGTLQGNGTISQSVSNWGTVNPGNSIGTLTTGNFTQHSTGTLMMEFDAAGHTDRLVVNGQANIDGSLALVPVAGYYSAPISFTFANIVSAGALSGSLPSSTDAPELGLHSPTLSMNVTNNSGTYTISPYRTFDAYSRHASDNSGASLGRVLAANAADARGDAQNLFAALDFSSPDGSTVRDSLVSLSPRAYGQSVLASLSLERQLSQAVLSRSVSKGTDNHGNRVFAMPLGGHLDAHDGQHGYRSNYTGMIAGAEMTNKGMTAGAHVAALHQSTRSGNAKTEGEGLWAGIHGTAAPEIWNGWQLSGLARLGVFKADMNRSIHAGSYNRSAESDWTQFSGTAVAHVGYKLPFGDKRFTFLPFAGADYAFLHQPSISEDQGQAARLKMDSQTYQSLRAVFGLKAETTEYDTSSADYTWRGNATLAYNRELLSHAGNTEARFIELNGDFTTDVRFATRSSVSASAGVSLTSSKGTTLDFQLTSEFAPGHGTSVGGFGRVSWPFR